MKHRIRASAMAGLASGLVVLGIGGRLLMRLLAVVTPEDPHFTWSGTLEVLAIGAAWGLLTGPLILVLGTRLRRPHLIGPVFGLVAFGLALVPFLLFSGFGGPIVAPPALLWLGALTFPALFVLHGMAAQALGRGRPEA